MRRAIVRFIQEAFLECNRQKAGYECWHRPGQCSFRRS